MELEVHGQFEYYRLLATDAMMWICFGFVIYMALYCFSFLSFIQSIFLFIYFFPAVCSSNIPLPSLRAYSFSFGNDKHVWLASMYLHSCSLQTN